MGKKTDVLVTDTAVSMNAESQALHKGVLWYLTDEVPKGSLGVGLS